MTVKAFAGRLSPAARAGVVELLNRIRGNFDEAHDLIRKWTRKGTVRRTAARIPQCGHMSGRQIACTTYERIASQDLLCCGCALLAAHTLITHRCVAPTGFFRGP